MNGRLFSSALVLGLVAGCAPNVTTITSPSPPTDVGGGFGGSGGSFVSGGGVAGGIAVDGRGGTFTKPVVVANSPPPPVSGGTLLALAHGNLAAVSDPDRDQIVMVDLDAVKVAAHLTLEKGDEPGRIAEDAAGHIHVALRGAGAIITIDPSTAGVLERRSVCTHPRGVAYDAAHDLVHVACAGGQLVSLPAQGGAPTRTLTLDADLRDIVVDGNRLLVSRFRAAELLVVEANGQVSNRLTPPSISLPPGSPTVIDPNIPSAGTGRPVISGEPFSPAVAWRTIAAPGGGAIMAFQEEQTSAVQPSSGGYGSSCGSIVRSGVAMLKADGSSWTVLSLPTVLPVDVTNTPAGSVEVISASTSVSGSTFGPSAALVTVVPPTQSDPIDIGPCSASPPNGTIDRSTAMPLPQIEGQVVAVAYDAKGHRLIQTREPQRLIVNFDAVTLPGESVADTGNEIFHLGTSGGLACASCHPEGREDGHLWTFAGLGARRTQSIRGGILGTEPFHWNGDMGNFETLAHEVFGNRMSGPSLTVSHVEALADWIDQIPAMKAEPVSDTASVDRGRAIFFDAKVGCSTCHAGGKMTNNATVEVGTGGMFQVPSLVGVAWRAPYLHSGCAPTLDARFGDCGGGDQHGHTSQLGAGDRADLIAFLKAL